MREPAPAGDDVRGIVAQLQPTGGLGFRAAEQRRQRRVLDQLDSYPAATRRAVTAAYADPAVTPNRPEPALAAGVGRG